MSEKDGGPAFPAKTMERIWSKEAMDDAGLPDALAFGQADHHGMTLRDYFAAQFLATIKIFGDGADGAHIAQTCYAMADAMLKERAK